MVSALDAQSGDSSTFKVLISTDNHLGYRESDPIRGNDSFQVFEEILKLGTTLNVDFLLHGGDLFDLHKPSRHTLYRTMKLLREYCFGTTKQPQFKLLNSSSRDAILKFRVAHYELPHHNISLPIFGIHGNHDDPGGDAFLSSLDVLEASSLMTYFGWAENVDDIHIHPLLFQKGTSKLALYGLGNIRDERLHRAFQSAKVHFHEPELGHRKDYFHLLVLHQNRYKGALGGLPNKDCIHEQMLPGFLDLVIWGHEHDSILGAVECLQAGFHIIQPGSSIPTSLTAGEALQKHAVLLEIRGDSFRSTFIPLRTARPIEVAEIILEEKHLPTSTEESVANCLAAEVHNTIKALERRWDYHDTHYEQTLRDNIFPSLGLSESQLTSFLNWQSQRDVLGISERKKGASPLPLIRLRVEHSGFETVATQRFGSQFVNHVANPEDILTFFKRRKPGSYPLARSVSSSLPELEIADVEIAPGEDIQDLIFTFVEGNEDVNLELLPEPDLNVAVQHYVHKAESSAIEQFVTSTIKSTQDLLRDTGDPIRSAEDIRILVSKLTDQARRCHLDTAVDELPAKNLLVSPTQETPSILASSKPTPWLVSTTQTEQPDSAVPINSKKRERIPKASIRKKDYQQNTALLSQPPTGPHQPSGKPLPVTAGSDSPAWELFSATPSFETTPPTFMPSPSTVKYEAAESVTPPQRKRRPAAPKRGAKTRQHPSTVTKTTTGASPTPDSNRQKAFQIPVSKPSQRRSGTTGSLSSILSNTSRKKIPSPDALLSTLDDTDDSPSETTFKSATRAAISSENARCAKSVSENFLTNNELDDVDELLNSLDLFAADEF